METVISALKAIFWGVVVLSLLVFVHEGGHYLAARAFKVRVTEFFLGMPCRYKISRKSEKVGTEFGVTPILIGGYNRICGMSSEPDELLAQALVIVTEAGRIEVSQLAERLGCDEDRAYGIAATLADWGSIRPFYDPERGEKPNQKDWPAAFESLGRDVNLLTEYDQGHDFSLAGSTQAGEGHAVNIPADQFLDQERSHTYLGIGTLKRLGILLAGPVVNLVLAFIVVTGVLMVHGVSYVDYSNTLGSVEEGSLAQAAGLQAGDVIDSVDGVEVTSWTELVEQVQTCLADGEDFSLTVKRDGQELSFEIDLPEGQSVEYIGIRAGSYVYHPDFLTACGAAVNYAATVGKTALDLIIPSQTMNVLSQSSSIVGISVMASEAASSGVVDLLYFAAVISMSLGFMNLLPIPPLDGGKILIELIQAVIRRPISVRVQNAISYVGLAFFLFVFVFVVKNDIVNFVIG